MPFKLTSNPTFKRQIIAKVPIDGGYRDDRFSATFRVLPLAEVEDFDLSTPEGTTSFLHAIIVELHDIVDEAGNPLSYSDEVRDAVLQIPYARRALNDEYLSSIAKAREGNSRR
jgi:hypothetical protein